MIKQNFVLVGLGSIGQRHLTNLRLLFSDAYITLVRRSNKNYMPIQEQADKTVSSIKQAIQHRKPTAAIISSPSNFHVSDAKEFLKLSCPVFIEKPLSNNIEGVAELITLAKNNNTVCMVGYILRFLSGMEKLKSIIHDKKYGDVIQANICVGQYLPDWRPRQDYRQTVSACAELGGGALLELSHELDYMIDLFGWPSKVSAMVRNSGKLEINVEDQVDGILYYEDGYVVHLHLDFLQKKSARYCSVIFEEAHIYWNFNTGDFIINNNEMGKIKQVVSPVTNELYIDELKHFFTCINDKLSPKVSLMAGQQVLLLIDALKRSEQQQKVVKLKKQ